LGYKLYICVQHITPYTRILRQFEYKYTKCTKAFQDHFISWIHCTLTQNCMLYIKLPLYKIRRKAHLEISSFNVLFKMSIKPIYSHAAIKGNGPHYSTKLVKIWNFGLNSIDWLT